MKKTFTNDSELLQGVNAKDPEALDQFLITLHAKATYCANKTLKDNHFAKDAVHDAHLAFIETAPHFDSLRNAENYFYTSVHNKVKNYRKNAHWKRWSNLLGEYPEIRDGTDPYTAYTTKEIDKIIRAKIETLPKIQQIIVKRVIDGYKTNEIANEIGKGNQYVINEKNKRFKQLAVKVKKLFMLL